MRSCSISVFDHVGGTTSRYEAGVGFTAAAGFSTVGGAPDDNRFITRAKTIAATATDRIMNLFFGPRRPTIAGTAITAGLTYRRRPTNVMSDNLHVLQFEVGADQLGKVIGRKGATLRRLREEFGVKCMVPRSGSVVFISGEEARCQECKDAILRLTEKPPQPSKPRASKPCAKRNSIQLCRFFHTKSGCRSGQGCGFLHLPLKDAVRVETWARMEEQRLVNNAPLYSIDKYRAVADRRIPNFREAAAACEQFLALQEFQEARTVKAH